MFNFELEKTSCSCIKSQIVSRMHCVDNCLSNFAYKPIPISSTPYEPKPPKCPLHFKSVTVSIPDPRKSGSKGEDAHFESDCSLGVFDGVGGWIKYGVDSGKYARCLSSRTKAALSKDPDRDLKRALQKSLANCYMDGSSTACLASLVNDHLNVLNVGDSRLLLMRNQCTEFFSKKQTHEPNSPFQVSHKYQNALGQAQLYRKQLQTNDVLILGTDGLWDNLSKECVERVVRDHISKWSKCCAPQDGLKTRKFFRGSIVERKCYMRGPDMDKNRSMASKITELILDLALRVCIAAHSKPNESSSRCHWSNGKKIHGGKIDDITITIAVTSRSPETFQKFIRSKCPACTGNTYS